MAWTLKNTQITSDEILGYNHSQTQQTNESTERERERERMVREARRKQQEMEDRVRDQFRDRESRHSSSPLHSSEFSLSSTRYG